MIKVTLRIDMKAFLFALVLIVSCAYEVKAQNMKDVDSFNGKTVTTNVTVIGNDTLKVTNVSVADKGNLLLMSPCEIVINGPFEVLIGGSMTVARPVRAYHYEYDLNGNRVRTDVIYK